MSVGDSTFMSRTQRSPSVARNRELARQASSKTQKYSFTAETQSGKKETRGERGGGRGNLTLPGFRGLFRNVFSLRRSRRSLMTRCGGRSGVNQKSSRARRFFACTLQSRARKQAGSVILQLPAVIGLEAFSRQRLLQHLLTLLPSKRPQLFLQLRPAVGQNRHRQQRRITRSRPANRQSADRNPRRHLDR